MQARRMGAAASEAQASSPPMSLTKLVSAAPAGGKSAGRYTSTRRLEGDYELEPLRLIGSGLSGPVRLVTARHDGQPCAVKSFNKTGLSARRLADLKSEAEVYLAVDHPHVARLEMVYETEEEVHLVMEYMQGGELYDRLAEQKQYGEAAAAEVTHQMLLAMAYLHSQGIAHRDVKLENFLYERKDTEHLKIIDFGFAKFVNHDTTMSQACGSIHYVAPEVLEHAYTEKADMWSMGVIVYMLLTGSPPFFGTDQQIIAKIKAADVHWSPRSRQLSGAAQDLLRHLFVAAPAHRCSAREALDHPWLRCRRSCEASPVDASILPSLRQFASATRFKRSVLYMMAWSMSTEEQTHLREQFLAIDQHNTGTITLQAFKAVLEEQLDVESCEAEQLCRSLDADHDDDIEYTEFLAAAMLGRVKVHEGLLRKTFARFDTNGDGILDREELVCVLGDSMPASQIEDLLREGDTKGHGTWNYEEFLAYFHRPELAGGDARRKKRRKTEQLSSFIDALKSREADDECTMVRTSTERCSKAPSSPTRRKQHRYHTAPPQALSGLPTLLPRAGFGVGAPPSL